MSSNNGEIEFVTPEQVVSERNLQRRIENALGLNLDDFDGDDTWMAAAVWNLTQMGRLQQKQLEQLALLTGTPVEVEAPIKVSVVDPLQISPPDVNPDITVDIQNITPDVTFPDDVSVQIEGIQIDQDEIAAAFEQATRADNRIQLYNTSVDSSGENILSQPLTATTDHSTFRVSVTLDTAVSFSLRTNPPDEDPFNSDFNQGGSLNANSKREFSFDADPEAEYNFRVGAAATVENLRIQEILTE